MGYIVEQIAPAAEPLERNFVKNVLKIPLNVTADDEYVDLLIQSAREEVEGFTGRSLINKQYAQALDSFPYFVDSSMSQSSYPPGYSALPRYSTTMWNYSQMIKLLRAPLRSVESIDYIDSQTGELLSLLEQAPAPWESGSVYAIDDQIQDANGNLQTVTAIDETKLNEDGTASSGATVPTWNLVVGGATVDNALTWTNGDVAPGGDFVIDKVSCPPRIFPQPGQTWPPVIYVPNAVTIRFTAGYGEDYKAVPATLRKALLMLVSDAYYNREVSVAGAISQNPALERALWRYKVTILAPTRG